MRRTLLLLLVALATVVAGCDDGPAPSAADTEAALAQVRPRIEQLDGVRSITRLGPEGSTGVAEATVVSTSIVAEPDVDEAGARRIVEQVAELLWTSDAPAIDSLDVYVQGEGFSPGLNLFDVLDDTGRDALEARFGPRP